MKKITSLNIIESSGIYDDYKKKPVLSQDNHVFTKILLLSQENSKKMISSPGQVLDH